MVRRFTFILVVLLVPCRVIAEAPADAGSDWKRVFSDDFDSKELDPAKWTAIDRARQFNNELQYYTPEEVSMRDGKLILQSRKREFKGKRFTSALVNTRGKFSQTFGKFEIRAKLPRGQGIWPAIWLLPEDGSWPPEIDIMEQLGHEPATIYMTNHWGKIGQLKNNSGKFTLAEADSSTGFHTYAVEWAPGLIRWFIDGELRHESKAGIPEVPMYLIINTAIGGDWPKNPDATTVFPVVQEIEFVRILQRGKDARPASVRLMTPEGRRPVKAGDVELVASVSDVESKRVKVEFYEGQTRLGEASSIPFRLIWKDARVGEHRIKLILTDDTGKKTESKEYPLRVE